MQSKQKQQRIASEQSMTQTTIQSLIEGAKAAIMSVRQAEISANTIRHASAMP